jgi:hypothetical protein
MSHSQQAPEASLNPLHLLLVFLDSLELLPHHGNESPPTATETESKAEQAKQRHILKVADFLFGSTLEKALVTLDKATIKCIKSVPSGRCIFLVQNKNREKRSTGKEDSGNYFCILPKLSSSQTSGRKGFHFCSCPAFYRTNKSLPSDVHKEDSSHCFSCCKHLLALKLLPYFGVSCEVVEYVTEDDFGKRIVRELLGTTLPSTGNMHN